MSGKASRERRKEAVKAARESVYKGKGTGGKNPFDNERQTRIFEQYVTQFENMYAAHKANDW